MFFHRIQFHLSPIFTVLSIYVFLIACYYDSTALEKDCVTFSWQARLTYFPVNLMQNYKLFILILYFCIIIQDRFSSYPVQTSFQAYTFIALYVYYRLYKNKHRNDYYSNTPVLLLLYDFFSYSYFLCSFGVSKIDLIRHRCKQFNG